MTRLLPGNSQKCVVRTALYSLVCLTSIACDNSATQESMRSDTPLATVEPLPMPNLQPVAEMTGNSRYFFNVKGHSREEVESLLNRALEIYEEMPENSKEELKIAMVLHGPDAQFFAKKNYAENKNLIDLATKLDAVGFIDMKVCARSAASQGIENDGFPTFIEVVPYGPEAIEHLKEAGFTEI